MWGGLGRRYDRRSMMTSKRFPVPLQRAPEQSEVRAVGGLQQTFTASGLEISPKQDGEIGVAVLDAIDAIQRERHTRRASAFGRSESRATKSGTP